MSLRIRVTEPHREREFEHAGGPLEFGRRRGQPGDNSHCEIHDIDVSRRQLRIEETVTGELTLLNLSESRGVGLPDGTVIAPGAQGRTSLPAVLSVGKTQISIERVDVRPASAKAVHGPAELETTVSIPRDGQPPALPVVEGDGPSEQLVGFLGRWLETLTALQRAGVGSTDFYRLTADALVTLVGLDYGLVLLHQHDAWKTIGSATAAGREAGGFSRTLVDHALANRQTIYQDVNRLLAGAQSLLDVDTAVVSPIYGLHDDVVGVLYGVRTGKGLVLHGGLTALDSQLVQLLAGAVGAFIARSEASRVRMQFEQFFSSDLARELERDPDLLEGRVEEITVLFSDLRGFTQLSQRLGAEQTCRMLRDMMECLSDRIVERGGAIVDYAGDGILAMWNAPVRQPEHAAIACRTALEMLAELPALNTRWGDLAGGRLALGIGINTGTAQVGNTGSRRKFKYGPHGHAVNLASRIQDATKRLGVPLLVSRRTREALPLEFAVRRVGQVRMPGVEAVETLFELRGADVTPEWLARRDRYEQALSLFETGRWAEARDLAMPLAGAPGAGARDALAVRLVQCASDCLDVCPVPFDPIIDAGRS